MLVPVTVWEPIMPRSEIYSTEFTERGWKSCGEPYGRKPDTLVSAD